MDCKCFRVKEIPGTSAAMRMQSLKKSTATAHPEPNRAPNTPWTNGWVAVKELKLSYHNMGV